MAVVKEKYFEEWYIEYILKYYLTQSLILKIFKKRRWNKKTSFEQNFKTKNIFWTIEETTMICKIVENNRVGKFKCKMCFSMMWWDFFIRSYWLTSTVNLIHKFITSIIDISKYKHTLSIIHAWFWNVHIYTGNHAKVFRFRLMWFQPPVLELII